MRQRFDAVAVGNCKGWVVDPALSATALEELAEQLIEGVPDKVGGSWVQPDEVSLGWALYDRADILRGLQDLGAMVPEAPRWDNDPFGIEAAWREAGGFDPPSPEG